MLTIMRWGYTVLAVVCGFGCAAPSPLEQVEERPAGRIVVMSAFAAELAPLLAQTEIKETRTVLGRSAYLGELRGHPVILLLTGIGIPNAIATTEQLFDQFQVSAVVFSGMAGGINPELGIGDVVVAARWGRADGGVSVLDAGFWSGADSGMLEAARNLGTDVHLERCASTGPCLDADPRLIVGGNGVSNSVFVSNGARRDELWTGFDAQIVDMETSEVARIANEQGVPFVAFRAISDFAGEGAGLEFQTYLELAAENAAATTLAFLSRWGPGP